MNAMRFQDGKGCASIFGRGVGLAAISLVLVLAWLAADPQAHEYFHHDAGKADHHCAITEFALGEAYFVAPRILVPPALAVFASFDPQAIEVIRQPVDYLLLPICGPPLGAWSA